MERNRRSDSAGRSRRSGRSDKLVNQLNQVLETVKKKAADLWGRIPFRFQAGLIALALILFLSFFYTKVIRRKTWMNRTSINGVDVSGKTMKESLEMLPDGGDYSLRITGREDGEMTILASDVNYEIRMDEDRMEELFKKQHKVIRFPWTSRKYKVGNKCVFNKEMLSELLDQCVLIKGSKDYEITKPVSADVHYSEKEKKPVVKKEVYGNTLNREVFQKVVEEALEKRVDEIDLDDKKTYPDVYQVPEVTSDSEEIKAGVKAYQSYINRYITWEIWEGETFTIKPEQITPLAYYKDGKMACRTYKLEKLIHKLCDKYKTAGKPRTFVTHNGKKVKVTKGDYGWAMDFAKTLDQAQTALAKELDENAVESYINNPSKENRENVTIHLKPQYKTKAFTKDYDNYQDWDPDTYTEVSIAEQMIYVHRDGKIAFKCKTISGLPVEGRETGKGVFYVKGRSEDRVLKGENYETPVKYWIRLTTSGTGFHAAPWQKWDKWTKTYYKKHGSHGCLNLTESNAKKMYKILEKGEAVFIY